MTGAGFGFTVANRVTRFRQAIPSRIFFNVRLAMVAAVCCGAILRLAAWWYDRSLWLDEVYLALNITQRSFAELWQPLDHDQGAPVGFLMLVKLGTLALGTSEMALRVVPMAAGLAALVLFPRVAGRLLTPGAALLATALFAFTPKLIYYSSELKQYSSDVLATLILFALATPALALEPTQLRYRRLAVAGAAIVWFSHPALFVLAGLGLVLFGQAWRRGDRVAVRSLVLVGAAWLASFAVCYVVCLRDLAKNSYLLSYWAEYFAPAPPRNFEQLGWYVRAVGWLFEGPAGMNVADVSFAVPAVLLFAAGLYGLFRDRPFTALALVAPLLVALFASMLGRYPFGGRLLLFAVPLLHLGLGAAWTVLRPGWRDAAAGLCLLVCAAVLLAPCATSAQCLVRPRPGEDHRGAIRQLAEHWQPGDQVLLSSMAAEPFDYYGRAFGLETKAAVAGQVNRDDWDTVRDAVHRLEGRERLWIFVAHERGANHKALTWQLDQVGIRKQKFEVAGAAVYLYDTRSPVVGPKIPKPPKRTTATASDASPIRHTGG